MIKAKIAQLKRAISDKIDKAKDGYYEAPDPRKQPIHSASIDELYNLPALQERAIKIFLENMTVQDLPLQQLFEIGAVGFWWIRV